MHPSVLAEHPAEPSVHPWDGLNIYEIYLRSFAEAGRSQGEGNLNGITSKLDYLQDIGVDAIWITPFYPSPMADGGYDVTDHCNVDPRFGMLADFDRMVAEAHDRGIRVIVDLVLNHTSNKHPKFLEESKQRPADPNDDWYIWRDGTEDGGPPNNWASAFSLPNLEKRQRGELDPDENGLTPPVSAWTWHPGRQQWYLHMFAEEQPDLNWDNPEVQAEVQRIMRFWADRGVDGFRVDAFDRTAKNMALTDEEHNPAYREGTDNPSSQLMKHHSTGFPGTMDRNLGVLTSVVADYPERNIYMMIETNLEGDSLKELNARTPLQMGAFNFAGLDTSWNARLLQAEINRYYGSLPPGAIGNQVTGCHDRGRIKTRLGTAAARAAMVVAMTLPGITTVYQGDPEGFGDVYVPPELRDDVHDNRDRARTPMLWTDGKNAGFSEATQTWLPIDPNYPEINIEAQLQDPRSPLNLFKKLTQTVRDHEALRHGTYEGLSTDDPDRILAYTRTHAGQQVVVVANLSNSPARPKIEALAQSIGTIVLTSTMDPEREQQVSFDGILLEPNEAVIIRIV